MVIIGDSVSSKPPVQIWSSEWESWVHLGEAEDVPHMSKIQILPQMEDVSQVKCNYVFQVMALHYC